MQMRLRIGLSTLGSMGMYNCKYSVGESGPHLIHGSLDLYESTIAYVDHF